MLRLAAGAAERTAELVPRLQFDQEAMTRNLDALRGSLGQEPGWAQEHVGEVGVWIDRVLGQHEEVFG